MPSPRKRFGQHFLQAAWVDKLVAAIDPHADETFIEIGPGRAALTHPLAARAAAVIAYEIDRDLARDLRATAPPNVTIVEGDFLRTFQLADFRFQISRAPRTRYEHPAPITQHSAPATLRVAANLPYNVASPILFALVDAFLGGVPLADATVMLQREVADRLVARPGTREYGVLTVLIGHVARVERLFNLPAGAFRPAPKVQSTVVRLRFHLPDPPVKDRGLFVRLVQSVFTRRRKTLANALQAYHAGKPDDTGPRQPVHLPPDIDGRRRPETLTIAEFGRLADVFSSV